MFRRAGISRGFFAFVAVLGGSALWGGCSGANGSGSAESDQQVTATACSVTDARTGRPMTLAELANLHDPIAKRLLTGACPQETDGILNALRHASDCQHPELSTRLVSDTSLVLDKPDLFRGVFSEDCQGGTNHDLFVSLFGIRVTDPQLPQDGTEVMGFDKAKGVFNFYVNEGGWKFMGSSEDAVHDGYTCGPNGDCLPKSASKTRCWACHESGGINMKEINEPWTSWCSPGQDPPLRCPTDKLHSDQVFAKFGAQLGSAVFNGPDMEDRTDAGNSDWNAKRVGILKAKSAADLLQPLFCTLTINLQTGEEVAGDVSFIPEQFFIDSFVDHSLGTSLGFMSSAMGLNVDRQAYSSAVRAIGQKVVGTVQGQVKQLESADGTPIVEPPFGFVFPKKGSIDYQYVDQLIAANLVDFDFVHDVLHVDFTRPIFSPTRCALLSAAPNISGANITPDKVRNGFKANLATMTGNPAAQRLLRDLGTVNDFDAHQHDVDTFFAACNARPKAEMVADILQYNAHLKLTTKAHRTQTPDGVQGIIEFAETLPVDDLPDTTKAFDPTDCKLK